MSEIKDWLRNQKREERDRMSIKKEMKTIKGQVEKYLKRDIHCRNSDLLLYYRILKECFQENEIGKPYEGIEGFDTLFLQALWDLLNNSPDKSSVKRVRAHIQNKEKRLRSTMPEIIKRRNQRAQDFKDWSTKLDDFGGN